MEETLLKLMEYIFPIGYFWGVGALLETLLRMNREGELNEGSNN